MQSHDRRHQLSTHPDKTITKIRTAEKFYIAIVISIGLVEHVENDLSPVPTKTDQSYYHWVI